MIDERVFCGGGSDGVFLVWNVTGLYVRLPFWVWSGVSMLCVALPNNLPIDFGLARVRLGAPPLRKKGILHTMMNVCVDQKKKVLHEMMVVWEATHWMVVAEHSIPSRH